MSPSLPCAQGKWASWTKCGQRRHFI